ncbi:MAG: RNA polymerase sigma factor, partial [Gemmataceae bacterium]
MTNATLAAVLHDLRRLVGPRDDHRQDDRQLLERFLARREEDAFALLIRRHGRMVLSACRRVLSNEADVEDAFQATFLVLLRRAPSMVWRTSIGAWLFGVAHRVAVRARADVQRRQRRESEASRLRPEQESLPDLSWREAVGILHGELDRLPDRYRLPLLLCYFDGKTREEAAAVLACSGSAVKGRLERGREMLRRRLLRRGLTLSGALLTAASLAAPPALALPVGLLATTIKAALATAAGEGLAGVVSASVAELVKGATTAMMVSKAKIATVVLLTASMMAGASVWT